MEISISQLRIRERGTVDKVTKKMGNKRARQFRMRNICCFFTASAEISSLNPAMYADRPISAIGHLRPLPLRPQSSKSYCFSAISTCKFVFFRNCSVKKYLNPMKKFSA